MSETGPTDERLLTLGGRTIPRIGLGTWELEGPAAEEGVRDALEVGYRHIDTARSYGNEREIGTAVGGSGVAREEIFLTTKLWHDDLSPSGVREQLERSLRALGSDYVDLLLIHWPNPEFPLERTLAEMGRLLEEEKVGAIGVSNFPTAELRAAIEAAPVPLLANQVEMHPFLEQRPLLELTAEHGIVLEAYSPLASGAVPGDETLAEIGRRYGKSGTQVALRWLVEHPNVVALPRSGSHANRVANLDVFDFELDDTDRERIARLTAAQRRVIDPRWAPAWD
jgi:2,5-diketo-D-gluconate reductase B